ncbi:MAG: 2-phosphosulfolactate phosphatase [Pirellulales bacterium]
MALQTLSVHDLPQHVAEHELAGSAVVVVDLLRASTTICQALVSGALEVVPFLEIDDALEVAAASGRDQVVLGGERRGKRIDGFDLGNSPSEYTPQAVSGRCVFLTTTNGTRALQHARQGRRVLIGAIVNLSAIAASLRGEWCIDILCAGTDGQLTQEDILAAGALVHELSVDWRQTNESADVARREWENLMARSRAAGRTPSEQLAIELRDTPGGSNLLAIGLDKDLVDCAQIDRVDVVPELDVHTWRIRPV